MDKELNYNSMPIGEAIRVFLRRKGISQQAAADQYGVSRIRVNAYLKELEPPQEFIDFVKKEWGFEYEAEVAALVYTNDPVGKQSADGVDYKALYLKAQEAEIVALNKALDAKDKVAELQAKYIDLLERGTANCVDFDTFSNFQASRDLVQNFVLEKMASVLKTDVGLLRKELYKRIDDAGAGGQKSNLYNVDKQST